MRTQVVSSGNSILTLLCLTVLLLSMTSQVSAQTELWGGAFSGSWTTDANWEDGTAPLPGSDVAFTAFGADYLVDAVNQTLDVDDLAISSTNATVRTGSTGGLKSLTATGSIDIFAGELQSFGAYNYNPAAGLTNHAGTLHIFGHADTTVSNGIVNKADGLIRVNGVRNSLGTATFGAKLVTNTLENQGTINLETNRGTNGGVFSTLFVHGVLNNSGVIDSRPFLGAGTGSKTVHAGTLNNSGTIINNDTARLTLGQISSDYSNSGTINAASGEIHVRNLNSFVNESAGNIIGTELAFWGIDSMASTLTNHGNLDVTGDLMLSNLVKVENRGDINVGGDVTYAFRTYEHKSGATLTGGNNLSLTNTTIDMENGFTTDFANVNLASSTIQGNGAYVSQSGTTTSIIGATLQSGASWENHGEVVLAGTNTISATMNGLFTNRTGGEFRIRSFRSNSGFINAGATMNMNGGLNNEGTIVLETVHGGGPFPLIRLNVAGTLNNSGVIESRPFEGANRGLRNISANIVHNSGSIIQNDSETLDFGRSAAEYTNSGNIDVLNSGSVRFLNMASFSNSGEINIGAGSTVSLTGGSFVNEVNGTINGEGTLNSTALTFTDHGTLAPGASPGTLTMNVNNYVQTNTGVFDLEIGGLAAGSEYDQIVFGGNSAIFNGTLQLSFIGGFAPKMGDEFDLLVGPVSENFESIELVGLEDGFQYSTSTIGGTFSLLALNNGVSAVPEPGFLLPAIFIGMLGCTRRRSKR